MLDTRPPEDLALGTLPNVYSIPYPSLLTKSSSYSTFLPRQQFEARLKEVVGDQLTEDILTGRRKLASTCLVGITASMLWISLYNIGIQAQVYDEVYLNPLVLACLLIMNCSPGPGISCGRRRAYCSSDIAIDEVLVDMGRKCLLSTNAMQALLVRQMHFSYTALCLSL